jgi:energy-coupling factor transporter transmembrane protein EcfT
MKVLNSLALSFLIIHTTQFVDIIKAASRLKVPAIFLLIVTLSYKLIFIFTKVLEDSFLGLKARWWRKIGENASRQIVGNRFLLVFNKTWHRYDQTYKAMIARGFNGTIEHGYQKKVNGLDMLFLLSFIVIIVTSVAISNVFQLY